MVDERPSAPSTQRAPIRRPPARTTPRTGSSVDPRPSKPTTRVPSSAMAPAARAASTPAWSSATPPRRYAALEAADGRESASNLVADAADPKVERGNLVSRAQPVKDAELLQPRHPARPQDVRRNGRARKPVLIEEQDIPASPRQQVRQRGARAAGAYDDRVVLFQPSAPRGHHRSTAAATLWQTRVQPLWSSARVSLGVRRSTSNTRPCGGTRLLAPSAASANSCHCHYRVRRRRRGSAEPSAWVAARAADECFAHDDVAELTIGLATERMPGSGCC